MLSTTCRLPSSRRHFKLQRCKRLPAISVSARLCVPGPDKPKGQGYVVYPVCVSYDVTHPAPDKPAEAKTMLAATNQWKVNNKNSALGATIDSLELS